MQKNQSPAFYSPASVINILPQASCGENRAETGNESERQFSVLSQNRIKIHKREKV
jgi:hypothetical protein